MQWRVAARRATLRAMRPIRYAAGWSALVSDPEWVTKAILGMFLYFSTMQVPLAGQIVVIGLAAAIVRRQVGPAASDASLPPFAFDVAMLLDYFKEGWPPLLVGLAWSFVPFCLLMGLGLLAAFAGGEIGGALADDPDGQLLVGLLACTGVGLFLVMPLYMLALLPARCAMVRTMVAGRLSAGFEVGAVFELLRLGFGSWLASSVLLGFAFALLGLLLVVPTCGFGLFFLMFVQVVVFAFVDAQIHQRCVGRGYVPAR